MHLNLISVLTLLAISSIQWGLSSGEELTEKASNNRPQRQTYYDYSYCTYYSYSLRYTWVYIVSALVGLCICFLPCIIIGVIACVAILITGIASSSSRNAPTQVATTQAMPNPPPQPYYAYPQPVQTHGYQPPGPPGVVKAPSDVRPPSYPTMQQDNPQPNIGFQT